MHADLTSFDGSCGEEEHEQATNNIRLDSLFVYRDLVLLFSSADIGVNRRLICLIGQRLLGFIRAALVQFIDVLRHALSLARKELLDSGGKFRMREPVC